LLPEAVNKIATFAKPISNLNSIPLHTIDKGQKPGHFWTVKKIPHIRFWSLKMKVCLEKHWMYGHHRLWWKS
jgi:hypothetical protein